MQRQRGGLVPIGEVFGGLDGPVRALRETPPPARRGFTLADQVNQLVSASEADADLGFMARTMALCSLPRSNPGNRKRVAPRIVRSGVSTSFRCTLWVVASRLRNRNVRLRESCEWPPSRPTREFIAVAAFGRQLRESDALRSPTPRQSSNLGIRFLVDAFARPQHLVAT